MKKIQKVVLQFLMFACITLLGMTGATDAKAEPEITPFTITQNTPSVEIELYANNQQKTLTCKNIGQQAEDVTAYTCDMSITNLQPGGSELSDSAECFTTGTTVINALPLDDRTAVQCRYYQFPSGK
ncbi:MAG: hypothetical protein F6K08_02380 [Okeania sp. SIO1H6]|nr:hypothetical protein [Okeania sp. SIO1H6]